MKLEQTFAGRIYNRLAAGPNLSARADCAHIAAEADAKIERLRILLDDARDTMTVIDSAYVRDLIACIDKALTPNV